MIHCVAWMLIAEAIPDEIVALKEALAIERAKGLEIAAELAVARAQGRRKTAR